MLGKLAWKRGNYRINWNEASGNYASVPTASGMVIHQIAPPLVKSENDSKRRAVAADWNTLMSGICYSSQRLTHFEVAYL